MFGYLRIVGHERDVEFHNKLLKEILKHAKVKNKASLPFTCQGNSCCEASKSTKTIVIKALEGRSKD